MLPDVCISCTYSTVACGCTVHLFIKRKGFPLVCKSIKMQDPGGMHVEGVLLLLGTVYFSIKFKLSCTVLPCNVGVKDGIAL